MKAYITAVILGVLLTPFAVYVACLQRGCWTFGGEYLLPGLFVFVVYIADMWKELME